MMLGARIGVLSLLGLHAIAGFSADAAVLTAIYTGNLTSGFDETGVFRTGPGRIAGAPFEVRYRYDTRRGRQDGTPGVYDYRIGGRIYGISSPVIDAALTINGTTARISDPFESSAGTGSDGLIAHLASEGSRVGPIQTFIQFHSFGDTFGSPGFLDQPFPATAWRGTFEFTYAVVDVPAELDIALVSGRADTDDLLTYSVVREVPEPGAWLMLVGGFGLVGGMLRRRVVQAVAADR